MKNMEDTYKDLAGVDISQQKTLWDERGKGYYGEYLVFSELYPKIQGNCKILMNLEIPIGQGKTTEIDLLLIHETGFYVFEIKHYKGTIYGRADDKTWTQYFRTTSNHSFYNPIKQNRLHIDALERMFPGIPMYSYIVFTNPDCEIKVTEVPNGVSVCSLRAMACDIAPRLARKPIYGISEIDDIFGKLKAYSPILEKPVSVNGNIIPFSDYIQTMSQQYQKFVSEQKEIFLWKSRKVKRRATAVAVCGLIVCLFFACIAIAGAREQVDEVTATAEQRVRAAEEELAGFAQKFEYVAEFNDGNISISDNLISVSDVVLEPSPDILNAVNFSCKLTSVSSKYGISIDESAVLIVILRDGSVKEYDLWNESYPYHSRIRMGKGGLNGQAKIQLYEFYDVDVADIAYVKLANLGVWALTQYSDDDIASGYEIELYDARQIQ